MGGTIRYHIPFAIMIVLFMLLSYVPVSAQSVRVCTVEESGPDQNGVITERTICPTDQAAATSVPAATTAGGSQRAGAQPATPVQVATPPLSASPTPAVSTNAGQPVVRDSDESIIGKVVDTAPLPIKLFAKAIETIL